MSPQSITRLTSTLSALCGMLMLASAGNASPKDTLDAADVSFVKTESAAGAADLRLAVLGVQKADRPDIKNFAEMLVTDHTKANRQLSALAVEKGVDVSAVTDPQQAAAFQKLEKASVANFDKEFLADLISGHMKCVSHFEAAAKGARNIDVQHWAARMLPTLKAHLAKARELAAD